jgi:hypothetical protein
MRPSLSLPPPMEGKVKSRASIRLEILDGDGAKSSVKQSVNRRKNEIPRSYAIGNIQPCRGQSKNRVSNNWLPEKPETTATVVVFLLRI